jgi:hypothetical protein
MVVPQSISLTLAALVPFPVSSPSYRGGGRTGKTGTYPESPKSPETGKSGKPGKPVLVKLQPTNMTKKIIHQLGTRSGPERSVGATTQFRWLVDNFPFRKPTKKPK